MSDHLDIRYVVQGSITSDDAALLDQIESSLPSADDVTLGNEFNKTREPELDADGNETGAEVLSARMTFAPDGKEITDSDGNVTDTVDPKTEAENLYNAVVSADLANKASGWEVRLYRSPEGGILPSDLQAWYEANPSEQPERETEDGETEQYIPSNWNPDNHTLQEDSA